jgi:hypothetical protein
MTRKQMINLTDVKDYMSIKACELVSIYYNLLTSITNF